MIAAVLLTARLTPLHWLDTTVIVIYFAAVLGLGFLLREQTHTSEDFFLAGREMSAWVAGVSFLAANMGALELNDLRPFLLRAMDEIAFMRCDLLLFARHLLTCFAAGKRLERSRRSQRARASTTIAEADEYCT